MKRTTRVPKDLKRPDDKVPERDLEPGKRDDNLDANSRQNPPDPEGDTE